MSIIFKLFILISILLVLCYLYLRVRKLISSKKEGKTKLFRLNGGDPIYLKDIMGPYKKMKIISASVTAGTKGLMFPLCLFITDQYVWHKVAHLSFFSTEKIVNIDLVKDNELMLQLMGIGCVTILASLSDSESDLKNDSFKYSQRLIRAFVTGIIFAFAAVAVNMIFM